MSSVQEIILFLAVVVASAAAVSTLHAVVTGWSGKGESASRELAENTVREICIQSVYSDVDTNIYVSAVLGVFDLNDVIVYVDGATANILFRGILKDSGRAGVFDASPRHQDLAYLTVEGNVLDGSMHRITVCIRGTCSSVLGRNFKELSNCQ